MARSGRRAAERAPEIRRSSPWARLLAAAVVVLGVLAGVWVTGGLITNDPLIAMALTGAWLAFAAFVVLLVAWRRRSLASVVVVAYLLTALPVGGYLLWTSTVDRTVEEQVVSAGAPGTEHEAIASGVFRGLAHETGGTATVLQRADGSRVLTLTDFVTDPGPDLRVYLTPGRGADITGAVDAGPLKGNRGNQQYDLPDGAPVAAVVIWCRAFTVAFGVADLDAAAAGRATGSAATAPTARSATSAPRRSPGGTSAATPPGTVVRTGNSAFGTMLFDRNGQAIYLFDREKTSRAECYGACAQAWPPVLTDGPAQPEKGVRADLLGTTQRTDGTTQVTYAGHPLYYYAHEQPGQVLCHNVTGFGGLWLVVRPNGDPAP